MQRTTKDLTVKNLKQVADKNDVLQDHNYQVYEKFNMGIINFDQAIELIKKNLRRRKNV